MDECVIKKKYRLKNIEKLLPSLVMGWVEVVRS